MRILILGGNGFIGKNLGAYLGALGYEVISFDIERRFHDNDTVTYVVGNFFDDNDLLPYLMSIDVVYHAISTINPGNSNVKYMQGYMYDFLQTVKLCDWSIKYGFKLIFLSSGGTVYGKQETMPIKEDTLALPINHYGNLKLCIENTIRTFNRQMHTNMIIARIANPYGPGQDYSKGVGFIDAVMKHSMHHEEIEIWGDGSIIRDYIYIDDVCGMLETLINYKGEEEVFNVGSGQGTSQKEILKVAKEIVPDIKTKYLPARPIDVSRIILDNQKIMSLYKKECITLEQGVKEYYCYLKKITEEGDCLYEM